MLENHWLFDEPEEEPETTYCDSCGTELIFDGTVDVFQLPDREECYCAKCFLKAAMEICKICSKGTF